MPKEGLGHESLSFLFRSKNLAHKNLSVRDPDSRPISRFAQNRCPLRLSRPKPFTRMNKKVGTKNVPTFLFNVPKEGLEPSHPYEYTILSRARLPIPPLRQFYVLISDFHPKFTIRTVYSIFYTKSIWYYGVHGTFFFSK